MLPAISNTLIDITCRLSMAGTLNWIVVVGLNGLGKGWRSSNSARNILDIKPFDLCKKLGYNFNKIEVDDLSNLESEWILIGGAGILPEDVVNSERVINSHPAYLPYVRGLDSLKWAIYYGHPIGVTTHIISEECDAGKLIRREFVPLYSWDTFHSVAQRQYELEIDMLVDSIEDVKTATLDELSTTKSEPMRRMTHRHEMRLMKRFQDIIDKVEI